MSAWLFRFEIRRPPRVGASKIQWGNEKTSNQLVGSPLLLASCIKPPQTFANNGASLFGISFIRGAAVKQMLINSLLDLDCSRGAREITSGCFQGCTVFCSARLRSARTSQLVSPQSHRSSSANLLTQ